MDSCRRKTLAESPVGRLDLCTCGTVHLAVGPVTMRLPTGAVAALRDLLDAALAADPSAAPDAHEHESDSLARPRRGHVH